MPRIYRQSLSREDQISENEITLINADSVKQLDKVLRIQEGSEDRVDFIDGQTKQILRCQLASKNQISKKETQLVFKVTDKFQSNKELQQEIYALIPVIKAENFEFIITKLTELGVQNFVPVIYERSQNKFVEKIKQVKYQDRIRKIIQEATEQCEGSIFANLHSCLNLQQLPNFIALQDLQNASKFLAHERQSQRESQFEIQAEQKPRVNLHDPSRPILFTLGPEGGITQVEASFLQELGFTSCSLGSRILRAETAAIVLASKLCN